MCSGIFAKILRNYTICMKDLDSWQDEVKTKGEFLRQSKTVAKKVWFSILFLEFTFVCNKCIVDLRICSHG